MAALHELGVLAALTRPRRPAEVAAELALDPAMLSGVLEYCAARTDIVERVGTRFAARNYDAATQYLLDLYAGAFAPNAVELAVLLRSPERAHDAVDRSRHARAFVRAPDGPEGTPAALLAQLGVRRVLDLGCGQGALLRAMAVADDEFQGWGIDANPTTCRGARMAMCDAGVSGRVRIIRGDGFRPERHLTTKMIESIEAVVARDLLDELFAQDATAATSWLRGLRAEFPSRLLLIGDYYGRLGHRRARGDRRTLLHDYAQVITGQGVPPPTRAAWAAIYRDAGVRLIHVMEDRSTTKFLHLLHL